MSKVALIILDGFGISRVQQGNAILSAKTPYLDRIYQKFPKALLNASSQEVGLNWGEVGNSEVGHTNIGLGRIVLQDLPQIDKSIRNGAIESKNTIVEIKKTLAKNKSNLHLMGIFSDGAVHGHIDHMISFIQMFRNSPSLEKIYLHLFADGRDCAEKSIEKYIKIINSYLDDKVIIASLSGRFYAMDRDKNYDRLKLAYEAIFSASPRKFANISEAVKDSYERKETDEFITPCSFVQEVPNLDEDVFVFLNYRADRAIQLARAFVDQKFEDFDRRGEAKNFYTLTTYDDNLTAKVIFSNIELNNPETNPLSNPLTKIISDNGLSQFHIAETEKYAHVTYFFAGGEKNPFQKQENMLIESAKVKSYDLMPQMRAQQISDEVILAADKGFDFIVANYANGDMVGHSGSMEAAVVAIEHLDNCLNQSVTKLLETDYDVFITSDHGNCDEMIDPKTKRVSKEHSLNPVPFIYVSKNSSGNYISKAEFYNSQPIGILADIAPTVLADLNIEPSPEMTGLNLKESLN